VEVIRGPCAGREVQRHRHDGTGVRGLVHDPVELGLDAARPRDGGNQRPVRKEGQHGAVILGQYRAQVALDDVVAPDQHGDQRGSGRQPGQRGDLPAGDVADAGTAERQVNHPVAQTLVS
jgi:hypothetical protein